MSALSLASPFPIFTDIDGNPLEDGYIYIGIAGLNPETNPIQAYWDAALTIPAAQPIRTLGGYPSRSGAAARIYVNSDDCSVLVKNKNGSMIFSALNQTTRLPSSLIMFLQAGTGAESRTVQNKLREFVTVSDFVPAGFAGSNYDAYIQAAVDFAVLNNRDLNVDRVYPITDHIVLNRGAVDGAGLPIATNDYDILTIFSTNHGGFSVAADNIGMFRTTLAYAATPQRPASENIRFLNLRFVADVKTRVAYVIKGYAGYMRTTFEHCSFEKIKLVTCAYPSYLQSIYLLNCLATDWLGDFMFSEFESFDIQVIGGRYEGTTGGNGFVLPYCFGSKIWTQIESVSGSAIACHGAKGMDISCYFEANGVDINTINATHVSLSPADARTLGVFVHGSKMSGGAGPNVVWGFDSYACVSKGNSSGNTAVTGVMHQIDSTGQVDINDYSTGLVSNRDAMNHSGNKTSATVGSFLVDSLSQSGAFTNSANTYRYCKTANKVDIFFKTTLTCAFAGPTTPSYLHMVGLPFNPQDSGYLGGEIAIDGVATSAIQIRADNSAMSYDAILPAKTLGQTLDIRGHLTYYTATT